jgi:hypothetical protein
MWEDNIKIGLKQCLRCEMDSSGSEQKPVASLCKCGNELPGFGKVGEFD